MKKSLLLLFLISFGSNKIFTSEDAKFTKIISTLKRPLRTNRDKQIFFTDVRKFFQNLPVLSSDVYMTSLLVHIVRENREPLLKDVAEIASLDAICKARNCLLQEDLKFSMYSMKTLEKTYKELLLEEQLIQFREIFSNKKVLSSN